MEELLTQNTSSKLPFLKNFKRIDLIFADLYTGDTECLHHFSTLKISIFMANFRVTDVRLVLLIQSIAPSIPFAHLDIR